MYLESAVTFLTERVAGTLVSKTKPFAAQGDWLQILIQENFLNEFQVGFTGINVLLLLTFENKNNS